MLRGTTGRERTTHNPLLAPAAAGLGADQLAAVVAHQHPEHDQDHQHDQVAWPAIRPTHRLQDPLTNTADGQRHRRLDTPTSVLLPPGAAGHPSTADSSTGRPVVRRSSAKRRCTYSRRINARVPLGHHVGAGPAKAGRAPPAARGRCFHQGASRPGMTGGYARSAASSAPTPGRCQPSRAWSAPASTSSPHYRATTSQDAMNRTDYRTCRPALHLPVLAQLTMRLLHERIPLTLLLDLSEPGGPNSTALLLAEGGADLTAGSAPTSTGRMTRCWTPPWVCTGPGAPSYEPPPHRGQLRHRLPSHAPYIVARQLPGPAGNVMSSTARPSRSTKMTMLVRSRVLAVRGRHSPGHWSGARRDRVGVGDPQLRFIDHGCQWRHGPARGETRREGTPRGPHTPPGGCWTVSQTLDTP